MRKPHITLIRTGVWAVYANLLMYRYNCLPVAIGRTPKEAYNAYRRYLAAPVNLRMLREKDTPQPN